LDRGVGTGLPVVRQRPPGHQRVHAADPRLKLPNRRG
jgi:hypothetical protein